ncbi:hypothetical protein SAMN05443247_08181 [Bradyrhizobium erythrophlei]|jgi:hypothetical protein|nr:hypothetical protein SAMN05443247_08181 [Bradyrhizobium erythrophlei]
MRPRGWKILSAIAVMVLPFGALCQTYDELSAMVSGPWHHIPNAVSALQFNRDEAKCRVVSAQTPIDSTTPAVVERVRWTVLVNCLKASGYEPGNAAAFAPAASNDVTKLAALRFDDYSCADITRLRKTSPGVDALFFAWARGFISGWNASAEKPILKVDPTAVRQDDQLKFIRAFCEANPSKLYLAGVFELLSKLKYEKARSTGKADED